MNERICELENQSYVEVTELVIDRASGHERLETFSTFSREKFAELLIDDVIRVVAAHALSNESAMNAFIQLQRIYKHDAKVDT